MKILVHSKKKNVDISILRLRFEKEGHDVEVVDSIEKGFSKEPDFVLMDIEKPKDRMVDFLKKFRRGVECRSPNFTLFYIANWRSA